MNIENKIAFCMTGHMRQYEKTYPYIKNKLLDVFDYDLFIHTWEDDITDWNNVIKLYNPTNICIEKQKEFIDNYENKHKTSRGEKTNLNIISMYYKIWKCNELKIEYEQFYNKQYKSVIRIRPDLIITEYPPEKELINNNILFVSAGNSIWVDDTFAFSSSNNMNIYSLLYNYLPELYELNNKSLHPEAILKLYLDKNNIKCEISKVKSGTLREDGTVMGHTFHVPLENI